MSNEPELDFDDGAAAWRKSLAPTPAEKLSWLRLIRSPHIGQVTFWSLMSRFEGAEAVIDYLSSFGKGARASFEVKVNSLESARSEVERAEALGLRLVAVGEAEYPPLLAKVERPPPLLYVKGEGRLWEHPTLAMVGSRKASAAGAKFAKELAGELSAAGFRIVSGLARGIDAAAHNGALPFGTAAVLPGGLDAIYPPEHEQLAAAIAQNGLLIGECAPGFIARAQDFPRRNRIISGASLGVIVVEATEKSGSLITARLAAEQNREVFAVPGHPLDEKAKGMNMLLKQGATLLTSAHDAIAALAHVLPKDMDGKPPALPPSWTQADEKTGALPATGTVVTADHAKDPAQRVFEALSLAPIDIDDLARLTGLDARHVQAAVLELELSGLVAREGLRRVCRKA